MTIKPEGKPNSNEDFQIQVLLTEYEKLRDELVEANGNMHQTIILGLGSVPIAIPLILGQVGNISTFVLVGILYMLAIVYATLTISFGASGYGIGSISKYIQNYIEPEINRLTNFDRKHKMLYWETYVRKERGTLMGALIPASGSVALTLMLLIPGAVSLITAQYMLTTYGIQSVSQDQTVAFTSSMLTGLSIIAWIAYIYSIVHVILTTIYNVNKAKWFDKGERK